MSASQLVPRFIRNLTMNSLTIRHRRFAVIALLAATWFFPASAGLAAPATDKLQVLLNNTVAQLQLAYRQHPVERAHRQEQLVAAVVAWRAAPRNEANNEKLANWLRAAMASSMPGSREPLPAIPSFAVVAAPVAAVKVEPQPEIHRVAKPAVAPQPVEKAPPQLAEPATEKHVPIVEPPAEKQAPVAEPAIERQALVSEPIPEKQAPVDELREPPAQDLPLIDPFRDDPGSGVESR